jgi:hypothetical protein
VKRNEAVEFGFTVVSPFIFLGLISGLILVVIYLLLARRNAEKPELADAINIIFGTMGFFGSIRLMGFVFSGEFVNFLKAPHADTVWSLTDEDATLLVIGGLALAWVSIQTIIDSFSKIKQAEN